MYIVLYGGISPYVIANILSFDNGAIHLFYHNLDEKRALDVRNYLLAIIEKHIDLVCPEQCYHQELQTNLHQCFTEKYIVLNTQVIWVNGWITTVDDKYVRNIMTMLFNNSVDAQDADDKTVDQSMGFHFRILHKPTNILRGEDRSEISQMTRSTSSRT
jgi:hypothetical protein